MKTAFQRAHETQIVARLMVEELPFFGIRNATDVATCLDGYDQTPFPRGSDWSFARFYLPQAVQSGYRLANDAGLLWDAFERLHNKHGLPGELEIPMESFARAVEIMLKDGALRDAPGYQPESHAWNMKASRPSTSASPWSHSCCRSRKRACAPASAAPTTG